MWIFGPIILLQLSEVYFPVSLVLRRSVGSFDTPGLCLHATRAVEQVEVAENNGEAGPEIASVVIMMPLQRLGWL